MPIVEVVAPPPKDYLDLVWDEFLASRGRGVSINAHFPWIGDCGVFSVVLREGRKLAGGLAIRPAWSRDRCCLAGLIGMVCIRADHRRLGLLRLLMSAAIDEARARGMDDLLLWTSKPSLYERFGFHSHDESYHGTASIVGDGITPLISAEDIDFQTSIPPFATSVKRFVASDTVVTVVDTNIVTDWEGEDSAVARMLAGLMAGTWQLHTLTGDTLPSFLARAGWQVELSLSKLQMILSIRDRRGPRDPYRLRLLERI